MHSTDLTEMHPARARIDAIFTALNRRLEAPEIDFVLGEVRPQALIHDSAARDLVAGLTAPVPHVT